MGLKKSCCLELKRETGTDVQGLGEMFLKQNLDHFAFAFLALQSLGSVMSALLLDKK